MTGKKRKNIAEIIFWIHFVIILPWLGLFLVPKSLWPAKVTFHFWYLVVIVSSEALWGLYLYSKIEGFNLICPVTSLMQHLRGYPAWHKKNYNHYFVSEFINRFKLGISYSLVRASSWIATVAVAVQYFLFN